MAEPACAAVVHPSRSLRRRSGECGSGDGERGTEHPGVGHGPRRARQQEQQEGGGQAKHKETDGGRDQSDDNEPAVAGAVRKRSDHQSQHHAQPQHGGHDLPQQRHAHMQLARHLRKEQRGDDEHQRGDEAAKAEGDQCAACRPSSDVSDRQVTHSWQDIVDDGDRQDRDVGVHGARTFRWQRPRNTMAWLQDQDRRRMREPEQGP